MSNRKAEKIFMSCLTGINKACFFTPTDLGEGTSSVCRRGRVHAKAGPEAEAVTVTVAVAEAESVTEGIVDVMEFL